MSSLPHASNDLVSRIGALTVDQRRVAPGAASAPGPMASQVQVPSSGHVPHLQLQLLGQHQPQHQPQPQSHSHAHAHGLAAQYPPDMYGYYDMAYDAGPYSPLLPHAHAHGPHSPLAPSMAMADAYYGDMAAAMQSQFEYGVAVPVPTYMAPRNSGSGGGNGGGGGGAGGGLGRGGFHSQTPTRGTYRPPHERMRRDGGMRDGGMGRVDRMGPASQSIQEPVHARQAGGGARDWRQFAHRSALLEEFRRHTGPRVWTVKELQGHMIEFSGDQHGSRLMQDKIADSSPQDRQLIFTEIYPHADTLITDIYGNYVVQKFFEYGSPEQRCRFAERLQGRVLLLSLQMYGCRKALEFLEPAQRLRLIKELDGRVLECVRSANANHVIQRIVMQSPPQFVLDSFKGHVQELALHSFGCRVMQKMVECVEPHRQRALLDEMHRCSRLLIEDPFGNYVVQSIVSCGLPADRARIAKLVKPSIFTYSRHKFASNVVEKSIVHCSPEDRFELINALVQPDAAPRPGWGNAFQDRSTRIHLILRDSFANFVFQTCLEHAEPKQRQQLIDILLPIMPSIAYTTVGRRLFAKIREYERAGFTTSANWRAMQHRFDRERPHRTREPGMHSLPPLPMTSAAAALPLPGSEDTETYVEAEVDIDARTEVGGDGDGAFPSPPSDSGTEASTARSGSGATTLQSSPDKERDSKALRPTASAPSRSDAARSDNWRAREKLPSIPSSPKLAATVSLIDI